MRANPPSAITFCGRSRRQTGTYPAPRGRWGWIGRICIREFGRLGWLGKDETQVKVDLAFVSTLSFHDARTCVIDQVMSRRTLPATEHVGLDCAYGRVLAADAHADRDYPALARSVRDGFAVRAADTPGQLQLIGEVRAGEIYQGQ